MILKLLLLIGIIAAVYYLFFKPKSKPLKKSSGTSEPKTGSDEMVECAKCGTYASVDEAIMSNGKYYCSQECLNS